MRRYDWGWENRYPTISRIGEASEDDQLADKAGRATAAYHADVTNAKKIDILRYGMFDDLPFDSERR